MSLNNLSNLNDVLFAQLRKISDPLKTSNGNLAAEMERSKAIISLSQTIIANASLALKATELQAEYGGNIKPLPMLSTEHDKDA